jgi:hypothetical protein
MLHVSGELFVRAFRGRHGRFNIGKLVTRQGAFAIKDVLIDELEEGAYRGRFGIERLFLANSQLPSGAIIVEMRAAIGQLDLDTEAPLLDAASIGIEEQDPLDEPATPPVMPQPHPVPPPANPGLQDAGDAEPIAADARSADPVAGPAADEVASGKVEPPDAGTDDAEEHALFGELWPLGDEVKLDTSVGRALMRRQIEALKRRGYRYQPRQQTWAHT